MTRWLATERSWRLYDPASRTSCAQRVVRNARRSDRSVRRSDRSARLAREPQRAPGARAHEIGLAQADEIAAVVLRAV